MFITSGLSQQSNKLEEIPVGAFNNLPNLRELYLQNNLLSNEGMDNETFRWRNVIVPKLWKKQKKAKAGIVLAGVYKRTWQGVHQRILQCQISDLKNYIFFCSSCSYLSSLECLDLSNNNLSTVPKGLPRSLVLLHLEKNVIHSIPGDALTPVRNLEYLLLHNNKLRSRSIHPAAFQVSSFFRIYFYLILFFFNAQLKHFQRRAIVFYPSPESNIFTRA